MGQSEAVDRDLVAGGSIQLTHRHRSHYDMNKIQFMISPQGHTRLETRGFTGARWRQASEFLEQALGEMTHEQLTTELY